MEWHDELVRLTNSLLPRLNRAVTVAEADGPRAGLAALAAPAAPAALDPTLPSRAAALAYLRE